MSYGVLVFTLLPFVDRFVLIDLFGVLKSEVHRACRLICVRIGSKMFAISFCFVCFVFFSINVKK